MGKAKLKSLESQEIVEFDVVTEERPEMNTEVSEHPIEDGASVSDHVALRPISISMNGVVAGEGAGDKIGKLRSWRNDRHRLRYTGRNIFKNYVISEMQTEHDARVGDGFRFRLVLQQVRTVKPSLVEITNADPAPAETPVANKQATTTAVKQVEDKGRAQFDNTGHPALGQVEQQADRYAGHPAMGQVG